MLYRVFSPLNRLYSLLLPFAAAAIAQKKEIAPGSRRPASEEPILVDDSPSCLDALTSYTGRPQIEGDHGHSCDFFAYRCRTFPYAKNDPAIGNHPADTMDDCLTACVNQLSCEGVYFDTAAYKCSLLLEISVQGSGLTPTANVDAAVLNDCWYS